MVVFCLLIVWTRENFTINKELNIKFVNPSEACEIFKKTNDFQKYIKSFRPYEKKIKNCENYNLCNKSYCKNFLKFSSNEKNYITIVIQLLSQKLYLLYPKLDYVNWKLIKSNHNIEDGMPFTLGRYIIIPQNIIRRSFLKYIKSGLHNSLKLIGNILVHEQFHINQRYNQKIFNDFYKKYWNFTYVPQLNIKPEIDKKIRTNPDGMDVKWIYKDKLLVLSLLKNSSLSSVDINKYLIEKDKNNKYSIIKQTEDEFEYNDFFCNINFPYHPNEISAYLFSDIIMASMNLESINLNCKSLQRFIIWLKNTFH